MDAYASDEPDFGEGIPRRASIVSPRELFVALCNPEENVHFFEAAFRFASAAFERAQATEVDLLAASDIDALVARARAEVRSAARAPAHATSWPGRVALEFAPTGLSDGVWLQGLVRANVVESEVGMLALRALMLRFGGPGTNESYARRYGSLLKSFGVVPATVTRWEPEGSAPCADISYEHALLGVALSLFPSALSAESLGFDLWMTHVGPCPLLAEVLGELRTQGADVRYFDAHDASTAELSKKATQQFLSQSGGGAAFARVARGFAAAHRSYRRWSDAVSGRNVPLTPRQFVLDAVRRKRAFSLGHHEGVRLGGHSLEELLQGDDARLETLLDRLASSPLVRPGRPDESPFLTRSIAFDGPMFDVFTASEQRDLREWIRGLADQTPAPPPAEPVALEGTYTAPADARALGEYAARRFGPLSREALCYHLANADRFPPVRLFARQLADDLMAGVRRAFECAPLDEPRVPLWSERAVAEIVAERHRCNVETRTPGTPGIGGSKPPVSMFLDGNWLEGFADVQRVEWEDYGWLFRIYASEQGDGNLPYNHNYIHRRAMAPTFGPRCLLPATDPRLYELCTVTAFDLFLISAALNARRFLPELLGVNLGAEAAGVGGKKLQGWKDNLGHDGNPQLARYHRLHNSIDNYASGHTKWSLAAVQAFMTRVTESAPDAVEDQWARIWRCWRLVEVAESGDAEASAAVKAVVGLAGS